ncbi:Ferric siderophore transport system, biopolymer transport protein ExbB [hydrothermal vent metagenome]|uniref:Ferric siderophore transport system, biopolymer transport protein ExbB n=1 Tax=hydrothermal vent metagenome TaxID=652676 RepID=A0A3B0VAE5_9ZZZZ
MLIFLQDVFEAIDNFFNKGGPVLYIIAVTTFIMWVMILDKFLYLKFSYKHDFAKVRTKWGSRTEHKSWNAHAIREKLISETQEKINKNIPVIKTLIALCPLLGLLGTVTGMIEVFSALAITGGGDAKSMAGGVSKATIPTMAGMVAALSGVFANTYITQLANKENKLTEEQLTFEDK